MIKKAILDNMSEIAFGPVPSRRLGQSVGINNIPPKFCTYSCVYCQLGRTCTLQMTRRPFFAPRKIVESVKQKIQSTREQQTTIDYLTFVSCGEPTLDSNLGEEIALLKSLDINLAVITNSSLLWREDVRRDLSKVDWVSLKIDAATESIWRQINRPHSSLNFRDILIGMSEFATSYNGDLVTETMLIQDVNDAPEVVDKVAEFIAELSPKRSYISVPIRPPAESWVQHTTEDRINRAFQLFKEHRINPEYLISYEGSTFTFTGNLVEDLLSIMSVHPIREDGVRELLSKAHANWSVIQTLLAEQKVVETKYHGKKFYLTKLPNRNECEVENDR